MKPRLALTAVIGATAIVGCAGARSTYRPPPPRPVPAAVTRLLKGITEDISAVSHKYPELSRWHLRKVHGMILSYAFRYRPPHSKRYPDPRIGRHGCLVSVRVTRGLLDRNSIQTRAFPQGEKRNETWIFEPIPDLELTVQARIHAGSRTSDGFMAEMIRITRKNIDIMKKSADPSTPPAPKAL